MKARSTSTRFCIRSLAVFAMFLANWGGAAKAQDAPSPAPQAPAQTPASATPPSAAPPQSPVIRAESKLVIVDAVVTDKKGNYVHDLKQGDFKVYEDNKEQQVSTFSSGAEAAIQANKSIKRYLVLFFDNSSMALPDQIQARAAAAKFIDANAGPDREMAVAEFSGTLRVTQNFTVNAEVLQAAVKNAKTSAVASNTTDTGSSGSIGGPSLLGISNGEAEFGARTMLLAMRTLARNLQTVPGRKMLVLFSAGFPLDPTTRSELLATIDACNKSNVAVYSLDVRGLMAPVPGGMARNSAAPFLSYKPAAQHVSGQPRLVLASYSPSSAAFEPQHPGGGGGGGAGGAGGGGGGGGKTGGGGSTGGTGTTGTGGKTGTSGTPGGTRGTGGTAPTNYNPYNNNPNFNPFANAHNIIPNIPNVSTNQEVLATLADGTGGFTIFNTNDLLGGLDRISKEGN